MSKTSVGSESWLVVQLVGGAEVGQLRLLIAGEHVHVEAESARDIVGELLAVGSVAHGARHHRDRPVRAGSLDQSVVVLEHRVLARERVAAQPAAGVDPGAEPGHAADARSSAVT